MNPLITAMIRRSGHPWWECRYSDGRVLSEWGTRKGASLLLPFGSSKTSRWELVPKDNMIGLRLLCPNGIAGELEAPEGHRFFQLKCGRVMIGKGTQRLCDAYIIGVVTNINGDCLCRAWETREQKLIEFQDNIYHMKYRNIGMLNLDVQGIAA